MMASPSVDSGAGSSGQGISFLARDLPSKRLLGKGLSSIVYETEWDGKRFARKDFVGVPSSTFEREAKILIGLRDHENVLKTHGYTIDKMSCSLVLEYVEEDLQDLLQKRKESNRRARSAASGSQCEGNPPYPFELAESLDIITKIARGMESLHVLNIPHGDLKTKNILVSQMNDGDKSPRLVKVADFGVIRTKRKSMSFVSRQARKLDAVQWKPPEVLERLLCEDMDVTSSESESDSDTESTGSLEVSDWFRGDVYSFALTCSHILTGEDPYPNGNWKELGPRIVSGELRPSLPASCPASLKYVLESCWGSPGRLDLPFPSSGRFWKGCPNLSQKGDYLVSGGQAREIFRQAVVAVTEAGAGKLQQKQPQQPPPSVKEGAVRYRECQKNHAVSIGGHAIDGCGQFMPRGADGTVDALLCAACDCHRNFHRREVEVEALDDCKKLEPKLPATVVSTTPWSGNTFAMKTFGSGDPSDNSYSFKSYEPDDHPKTMKDRFRTQFTAEQKEQMSAFAERVGWRIQKHDEAAVQDFCATVGVKRHVLKVWMHNNKYQCLGKKP